MNAPDSNASTDPLAHFSRMIQHVYAGALRPGAWDTFLAILGQRLDASRVVLILRTAAAHEQGWIKTYGVRQRPSPRDNQYHVALDPFINLPDGKAMTLHEYLPPGELERSEYFRSYLEPQDLVFALGVDITEKNRFSARLRLARSRSSGNFTGEDCQFVQMLVPHLRTALLTHIELDKVRLDRAHYSDAMDRLTMATIILDETGKVIHTSRLAESILRERDGIAMHNDQLALSNHEDSKRFREIVANMTAARRAASPGVIEVMRARRPSGKHDISLVVRPSQPRVGENDPHMTASVAVFLSVDSELDDAQEDMPLEFIQKLFSLTPKEASLALRLASGKTLQEAAQALGISQNTARAHLRGIFAKTGFDRQTKLVRALLKSVAMLGQ